jgi:hypothetical protein
MQHDPVVAMAGALQAARRSYYAADDAHDEPEARWRGLQLINLEWTERSIAPTSNAGAGQKMHNVATDVQRAPGANGERFARSAIRIAAKIERGDITPLLLRAMRALMPAALRYDSETCNDGATAKALMHAITWCARLRLVQKWESTKMPITSRGT